MVQEVIPLVAKCAVNNSKVFSNVGIVGFPAMPQKTLIPIQSRVANF